MGADGSAERRREGDEHPRLLRRDHSITSLATCRCAWDREPKGFTAVRRRTWSHDSGLINAASLYCGAAPGLRPRCKAYAQKIVLYSINSSAGGAAGKHSSLCRRLSQAVKRHPARNCKSNRRSLRVDLRLIRLRSREHSRSCVSTDGR